MNNAILKRINGLRVKVALGSARYGTPRPEISVRVPTGTGHRKLNAALHAIAAEVELATPAGGQWVVEVDCTGDEHGYVYLELIDGNDTEVERAMSVLRQLVG